MNKLSNQFIINGHLMSIPNLIVRFVKEESERDFDGEKLILKVTLESYIKDLTEMGFTLDQCSDVALSKIKKDIDDQCELMSSFLDYKIEKMIKYAKATINEFLKLKR
jgi:hypothetical protein